MTEAAAQAAVPEPTPAPVAQPALWGRILVWLRWAKALAITIAVLFVLTIAAEAARLYFVAREIHPILGYAAVAVMLAAGALLFVPAYRFLRVPRALKPPENPPLEKMRMSHIRAEVRFLGKYLRNCARNPEFEDRQAIIETARGELAELLRRTSGGDLAASNAELEKWTAERMGEVLRDVDERADRLIYQEALTVGVGTAASPNGTLDAFVVLWRSLGLTGKLAVMYYGRPGPMGILAICRDVTVAAVSAAYLDRFSDSLGSVLAKTVGGVAGVVAGPAVEGVTNAMVLIRIGYLTKERCRSFRYWNQTTQRSALVRALRATQRVAVGLTTEIFRQVGGGLGAVADAAARGIAQAAGAAADRVSSAAGSAWTKATEFGGRIGDMFGRKKETVDGGE